MSALLFLLLIIGAVALWVLVTAFLGDDDDESDDERLDRMGW